MFDLDFAFCVDRRGHGPFDSQPAEPDTGHAAEEFCTRCGTDMAAFARVNAA